MGGVEQFVMDNWILILAISVWTVPWKGVALWKAAKRGDRVWFIILLVVNTLAVLEILYIFLIARGTKASTPAPQAPAAPTIQTPPTPPTVG